MDSKNKIKTQLAKDCAKSGVWIRRHECEGCILCARLALFLCGLRGFAFDFIVVPFAVRL